VSHERVNRAKNVPNKYARKKEKGEALSNSCSNVESLPVGNAGYQRAAKQQKEKIDLDLQQRSRVERVTAGVTDGRG